MVDNKIFTSSNELNFKGKLSSANGMVEGICLQEGFRACMCGDSKTAGRLCHVCEYWW